MAMFQTMTSLEGPNGRRGFWETVLARSTSHGKLRGLLNNFLPDPNPPSARWGSSVNMRSSSDLKLKLQAVEEPEDDWRRVKEDDDGGRGVHGEERTQCTRAEPDRAEHTHGHDSSHGSRSSSSSGGAETAPTGNGMSAPRDEFDVSVTPSTEEMLQQSFSCLHAHEPPPPASRLRTCAECDESIEGAVFMLHDQPYCCQRHRLAAYHKTEKRRRDGEKRGQQPQVSAAGGASPTTGLAARFGTW